MYIGAYEIIIMSTIRATYLTSSQKWAVNEVRVECDQKSSCFGCWQILSS